MDAVSRDQLLVVGCSATKVDYSGQLPAIIRYDGPMFRVMRAYMRDYRWPSGLSVAVLSAEYGLVGAMTPIPHYDRRMDAKRAEELAGSVTSTLVDWKHLHKRVDLVLGQGYQRSVRSAAFDQGNSEMTLRPGPIGLQLAHVSKLLKEHSAPPRRRPLLPLGSSRPIYFLPDWDDFLDVEFDFEADRFSSSDRRNRKEAHSISLMRPRRLCDGVLVSLAQHMGAKGMLKRFEPTSMESLAPSSVREHFELALDQFAFGDCGAFSYVNEDRPIVTVEQAVALYDLYDFDLGASVDHIPVGAIETDEGIRQLSVEERNARVLLTRDNADRFLRVHSERKAGFIPVGVIQGLAPEDYAAQIGDYLDMGYECLAFGGLVPRSDVEIAEIIKHATSRLKEMPRRPWIHLLGIFRPKLQSLFRSAGIDSFDSATYFRKSWLRSGQNYLSADGNWYAAIRVPPSHDPRTLKRLLSSGHTLSEIEAKESAALAALRAYDRGSLDIESCLKAVLDYDKLLDRAELISPTLVHAYRRTLNERPWRRCDCPMCQRLGIDIVIFRGLNRNKRRGAHNTLMLYRHLRK